MSGAANCPPDARSPQGAFGKGPGSIGGAVPGAPPLEAPGAAQHAREAREASGVLSAVAVALCLEELDHLRAMECLPTPGALLDRLQARTADFDLLAGVAGAYLHQRLGAREVR
jgi:hypothetical protein